MKKLTFSVIVAMLLVFFVSCDKEEESNPKININNSSWNIVSTLATGSTYNFDILFKDNDSFYINSLPIALGTWATSGDSVVFGVDTMGVTVTYKGGFPTDTTMQGRMTYGVLPLGTFTGVEK
jgi:hypothetical protein